jgi:hypothetical protein
MDGQKSRVEISLLRLGNLIPLRNDHLVGVYSVIAIAMSKGGVPVNK